MGEETRPASQGDQAAAIARHIVHVTAEYTGRGPTRARVNFGEDVITVVLSDNFTKGERSLIAAGQADTVVDMRRSFQQTMRPAFVEGIERITGRTVIAFLSDHSVEPDVAVETFILKPL